MEVSSEKVEELTDFSIFNIVSNSETLITSSSSITSHNISKDNILDTK